MDKADRTNEPQFVTAVYREPGTQHESSDGATDRSVGDFLGEGWGESRPFTIRLESYALISRCRRRLRTEIRRLDADVTVQNQLNAGRKAYARALDVVLALRLGRFRTLRDLLLMALRQNLGRTKAWLHRAMTRLLAPARAVLRRLIPSTRARAWIRRMLRIGARSDQSTGASAGATTGASRLDGVSAAVGTIRLTFHGEQRPAVALSSGYGDAVPSYCTDPVLRRPGANSYCAWLCANVDDEFEAVRTFAFDSPGDVIDVSLLRGRLFADQEIQLRKNSPMIQTLALEWSNPGIDLGEYRAFRSPPAPWRRVSQQSATEVAAESWSLISVVTVSFNQVAYLESCIQSVLGQAYPNLEYIVVDACSTDGSIDLLNKYRDDFACLIIEEDRGQSDGLNKGFARATGEILTWVNSDDLLAPGALMRVGRLFQQRGDVDLVVGGCNRIGESEHDVLYRHHCALPLDAVVPLSFERILRWDESWHRGDYFFQPEVFFRQGVWQKAGGFLKPHLYWAMDYDLWVRMALAGANVLHIPEVLACSRVHAEQKTTADKPYLSQIKSLLVEYDNLLRWFTPELTVREPRDRRKNGWHGGWPEAT